MPKIIGDRVVALITGQFITAGGADQLRNVRVGVKLVELIAALREWIQEFRVVEPMRKLVALFFAGDCVEIEKRFSHSTVLDHQHFGPLLIADRLLILIDPSRHFLGGLERLLVSAKRVHVEMTGENLVIRVKRCPNASLAFTKTIVKFRRVRAEITILTEGSLTLCQFGDERIALLPNSVIAGRGIMKSAS